MDLPNSSGGRIIESAADWRVLMTRLPTFLLRDNDNEQLPNRSPRQLKRLDHRCKRTEKLHTTGPVYVSKTYEGNNIRYLD